MSISEETDLRREFEAVGAPSSLTFSPEYVLRKGSRALVRRRVAAVGSAAIAVGLIAVGSSLLTRSQDSAAPQPAARTVTSTTTAIVRAESAFPSGAFQVELNRDTKVTNNVKLSVILDKRRYDVGTFPAAKPGQQPDAIWRSGTVKGHPFTFGVVPGTDFDVKLANNANYGFASEELKGTGYSMFAVTYQNGNEKEPARPAQIASISWSGPAGVVDGIEGDHRLTGQVLKIDSFVSEKVVIRAGTDGRSTVSGEARRSTTTGGYATPQTMATIDASGVAVVTGRYPVERRVTVNGRKVWYVGYDGAPLAAGILPLGASDIAAILTTNEVARGLAAQARLPDFSVIFAIKAEGAHPTQPSKDSIKAITWTNPDGTHGRKDVTQQKQ